MIPLYHRFREFGGWHLVVAYIRMGLFWKCFTLATKVLIGRIKPMDAYHTLLYYVEEKLREEFEPLMLQKEKEYGDVRSKNETVRSNYVWTCWLQGMDNAPNLVKVCYASMREYLKDREIVLLTKDNIEDYVSLPDIIEEKHKKGIVSDAHYTDLLRLQLLIEYGGTWIDSTVLCTGENCPTDLFDCDLFVFQQLKKGEYVFRGISNWFITSCSNNRVIMVLRDMLLEYWKRYNCVVDYFIFHLFFSMLMEHHPDVAKAMPRHGNRIPHYLSKRMADKYDDVWMQSLKQHSCFHKLSHRMDKQAFNEGSFYDVVVKNAQ